MKYFVADGLIAKQQLFQINGFDCGVFMLVSVLIETKGSMVNGSILSMIYLEIIGVYIIYHFLKKVVKKLNVIPSKQTQLLQTQNEKIHWTLIKGV